MKVAVRIWLFGALVPFVAFSLATVAGAVFFGRELERSVDRALMVQAATEAASLFDDIGPHLHVAISPLEPAVRRVTPAGALYNPAGDVILRHPQTATPLTDAHLDLASLPTAPVLTTRTGPAGERVRVLTLAVPGPDGQRNGLQLAASLESADESVRAFLRTGFGMSVALGAILFTIQGGVAHRLTRRVDALSRHMAALREGKLDSPAPDDAQRDEVGELSRVVAAATERLRAARAAQERLIADAAHELRTPLQLMRTSIDLGLRRERSPEELRASLSEVRGEVDRLASLATRLLDLAAAGRGTWDRTPGDLVTVAREAAEAARAEAETRQMLVEVRAPAPVPASFDANSIRQALDNLLGNALKFGPRGGTVRVEVALDGPNARILVHDDGPGIPADERERVFEPFEQGKVCAPGGVGLGLAIVSEVARGHGGRAFVAEGQGGNVAIEFPARPA